MVKKLCFTFVILLPMYSFAQYFSNADSTEQRIISEDCDDKIFNKVEILPSLKKGAKNFEDTLSYYLKVCNAFKNDSRATFRFLVTTSSHIFDIKKEVGNFQNEALLKEILISHSSMWKTAVQNDRQVCAYISLEIEILNEVLTIAVK